MLYVHVEQVMQNALFLVSKCHRPAAEWRAAGKQGYLFGFKQSISSQVMFCDECGSPSMSNQERKPFYCMKYS